MNTFKNILLVCGLGLMIFVIGWGRDVQNLPLLLGETARTEGRVTEVTSTHIQDGVMQQMKYVFEVDGQTYEGVCEIGGWFGQNLSDTVGVKYIVKDPSNSKVVWFKKK
jgi:hypothetical protein